MRDGDRVTSHTNKGNQVQDFFDGFSMSAWRTRIP
jgi:hypothetical protein